MPHAHPRGVLSTNPNRPCPPAFAAPACPHLKARCSIGPALLLATLLLAGCNAVPTSYEKWKTDQEQRAQFAAAGVPYKSPSELRAEAGEMREIARETTFAPAAK